ncbi:HET-domain-containing protein, partial [Lindgomyces ingoldianus]
MLARYWLETCNTTHNVCQQSLEGIMLPLKVLDVSQPQLPRLVCGESEAQYVTLSYKWGNGKKFLMTSTNMEVLEAGFNPKVLPRTFRDAIKVTHALGLRYLWIDALCIQQDSPEQLKQQINLMDKIFLGSTLTIFASAAENADVGLALDTPAKRIPVHLPINTTGSSMASVGQVLVSPPHHWDHDYDGQGLHSRAWVLQEEVLSRRGLSFWSDQMRWRCESKSLLPRGLSSWKLELESRQRQLMKDEAVTEWYSMVSTYSQRHLSFRKDALNGVAGIASLLGKTYELTYLAGLWAEDLGKGLIWRPYNLSKEPKHSNQMPEFPSWSWAS